MIGDGGGGASSGETSPDMKEDDKSVTPDAVWGKDARIKAEGRQKEGG